MGNPSLSKNQSLLCHQSNSHQDTPILDTTATHSSHSFLFSSLSRSLQRGLKQATLTREFKTTRCHDTPETKRPGYRLQEKFFVINVSVFACIYPILGRRTSFLITATNRADVGGGRSNKVSWNIDPVLSLSLSFSRRIIIKVPTSVAAFERTLPSALLPTSRRVNRPRTTRFKPPTMDK